MSIAIDRVTAENFRKGYIVGAYVTSPCLFDWNQTQEEEYWEGIRSLPYLRGLEHPFWGSLHPFDEQWFLEHLEPSWEIVLTCVPGTMQEMTKLPSHGLASNNPEGRMLALNFMKLAQQAVHQINEHTGKQSVIAVQFVSAPQRSAIPGESSGEAFQRSLQELILWDWQGADLVVEHCDAFSKSHIPEKGFLTLEEEIQAIKNVLPLAEQLSLGITINWARSVLETRQTETPVIHVLQAKEAGFLKGLMFSGCSNQDTAYGVWKDTHMPPSDMDDNLFSTKHALMTPEQIKRCLLAADCQNLSYLGIKIMALPQELATIENRVNLNRETLRLLRRIQEEIG